jgi:hypothetical protein
VTFGKPFHHTNNIHYFGGKKKKALRWNIYESNKNCELKKTHNIAEQNELHSITTKVTSPRNMHDL